MLLDLNGGWRDAFAADSDWNGAKRSSVDNWFSTWLSEIGMCYFVALDVAAEFCVAMDYGLV